jgi:hypothetical protein
MSGDSAGKGRMNMQITVTMKDVYGEPKCYPACSNAEAFAAIAGTKTLTRLTLREILRLGYTIIELNRHGRETNRYSEKVPPLERLPAIR